LMTCRALTARVPSRLTVFYSRADNAIAADDLENRPIDADSR
jgi:hypothetical protein